MYFRLFLLNDLWFLHFREMKLKGFLNICQIMVFRAEILLKERLSYLYLHIFQTRTLCIFKAECDI